MPAPRLMAMMGPGYPLPSAGTRGPTKPPAGTRSWPLESIRIEAIPAHRASKNTFTIVGAIAPRPTPRGATTSDISPAARTTAPGRSSGLNMEHPGMSTSPMRSAT